MESIVLARSFARSCPSGALSLSPFDRFVEQQRDVIALGSLAFRGLLGRGGSSAADAQPM